MAHDVFVCYSVKDKTTADAVVAYFEERRLRCWYAPRDILPGKDWAGSIVDAINDCRIMILLFTDFANESDQVLREVGFAMNAGKTVIPFKLTPKAPTGTLGYYLKPLHWLDAMDEELKESIEKLYVLCDGVLKSQEETKQRREENPGQASGQPSTSATYPATHPATHPAADPAADPAAHPAADPAGDSRVPGKVPAEKNAKNGRKKKKDNMPVVFKIIAGLIAGSVLLTAIIVAVCMMIPDEALNGGLRASGTTAEGRDIIRLEDAWADDGIYGVTIPEYMDRFAGKMAVLDPSHTYSWKYEKDNYYIFKDGENTGISLEFYTPDNDLNPKEEFFSVAAVTDLHADGEISKETIRPYFIADVLTAYDECTPERAAEIVDELMLYASRNAVAYVGDFGEIYYRKTDVERFLSVNDNFRFTGGER